MESKDCAVVRAVTFYQCGPGVRVPASKPHPGTPVFPPPEKPSLPNYNSIWNARTLPCFMGEQITIFLILSKVKRACLDRFSSSPAPLGFLQCPVTIFTVTTSDKCLCDNLKQCRYSVAMQCWAKNRRCESFLVPEFYGTFLHSSIIQDWRHITIVKNDTIDHHHNLSF